MGRKKKVYRCKMCGKILEHKTRSGLCEECAIKKNLEVIKQLKEKRGFYYELWKKRIIEGVLKAKDGGNALDTEMWRKNLIKGVIEKEKRVRDND